MANKFSKLCIDKTRIADWIKLWCESKLTGTFKITQSEDNKRIKYIIDNEGNIIKIDFIKCAKGLLTISPNVGNNIDLSKSIAESIYERVKNVLNSSPFSNGFSLIIPYEDFEIVIGLIENEDGVVKINYNEQLEAGKAQYYLYQFKGVAGDTITIKYFIKTKRMQLQGKPLTLFNEVVSMVSENGVEFDDIVDAQIRYCNVGITPKDIYEEMEAVLGEKLYNFLSTAHKSILSTAFILSKIEVEMPDYSGIVQQALRAYEGFAKKLFTLKGLQCINDTQLGKFFSRPDKSSDFTMNSSYSETLDTETSKQLTYMYKFYYNKRHPYSHATPYDFDTNIIQKRSTADELFSEIITNMKKWIELV